MAEWMNTCNLRSFFPGSQPDYHQPVCPEELSGDMNSLLNSFLEQKQTQKCCVWRWGRGFGLSQPFYDLITKDKVRTNNSQPSPSTGPWGLVPSCLLWHLPSGLDPRQESVWSWWCLGAKRPMVLEIVSCQWSSVKVTYYLGTTY